MGRNVTTVFVLLLKSGVAFVEECMDGQEFATAERAGAGILGVFDTLEEAAELMQTRLQPGIEVSFVKRLSEPR